VNDDADFGVGFVDEGVLYEECPSCSAFGTKFEVSLMAQYERQIWA